MNPLNGIVVPPEIFWPFLIAAFSLLGALIRERITGRAGREVLKDAAEKVPPLVRTTAEDRGMASMLPPPSKKRPKLDTLTAIKELRGALDEQVRLENTRVYAVNLPSERPFARLQPTDETPPEPGVQRMRQSTPGQPREIPHLGFAEDRQTPTEPSGTHAPPKRR